METKIQENLNLVIELTPEELWDINEDLNNLIDSCSISSNTKCLLLGMHGCMHAISYEMGRRNEQTIPQTGGDKSVDNPRQQPRSIIMPGGKVVCFGSKE